MAVGLPNPARVYLEAKIRSSVVQRLLIKHSRGELWLQVMFPAVTPIMSQPS